MPFSWATFASWRCQGCRQHDLANSMCTKLSGFFGAGNPMELSVLRWFSHGRILPDFIGISKALFPEQSSADKPTIGTIEQPAGETPGDKSVKNDARLLVSFLCFWCQVCQVWSFQLSFFWSQCWDYDSGMILNKVKLHLVCRVKTCWLVVFCASFRVHAPNYLDCAGLMIDELIHE